MESVPPQKLPSGRPDTGPNTSGRSRPVWGDGMDAAIYECPKEWEYLLPSGTRQVRRREELAEHIWPLLALTPEGCRRLAEGGEDGIICRLLLVPGDLPSIPAQIRAETIVSYGLSPRDSLTLSSLTEPVLCVQRALPRADGAVIEPQEFPLPALPGPAEALLPLLGLRLLRMPLTDGRFP